MNKTYRILISIAACLATCVIFSMIVVAILGSEAQGLILLFIAFMSVTVGRYTYKNLKVTPEEEREKKTNIIERGHPNGITKERGKTVSGKRDGVWEFYNEEGVLVKEIQYKEGDEIKTTDY